MKRTTSTKGEAAKNTSPKSVEEYLSRVPEPARSTLHRVRAAIRSVVPPETTEAIGYGIPMFRYKGGLVAYAAFLNHCSFFPMNASLISVFKKNLKGYETSKGTIRFPVDKPLPATLIKKLVRARMADKGHAH
jgi:uncharacterized protein YdhG (YjbR/CyaY superfamily)